MNINFGKENKNTIKIVSKNPLKSINCILDNCSSLILSKLCV